LAFAAIACVLPGSVAFAKPKPLAAIGSWIAYGHDPQLTNFAPSASLTPATAPDLTEAWRTQLDGPVVASPVFAHGLLVVSTEAGSIYALNPVDGSIVWVDHFGTIDTPDDACGSYGFSSTPAIDMQRGLVYAISADGHLHALDLASGAEAPGWPVDVTVARNEYEYVWGGLRLFRDQLYVPVSSYCDQPGPGDVAAEGRLVAIDVGDRTESALFDPVPGYGNLGGIWGWGGVSIAPSGTALYVGVGNSYVRDSVCGCYVETVGYGDALVELTPSLEPLAANRPQEVGGTPPGGDIDFGAAPSLFDPPECPPLAAANNKLGILYIWNRDALAQGPLLSIPLGDGVAPFVGQPAYSPRLHMLFDAESVVRQGSDKLGDGIAALGIESGCRFGVRWTTNVGSGNQPPPIVVGDVVVAAGGDPGGYVALNARTGAIVWRYSTDGAATMAPVIAVADGLFAADAKGVVRKFVLRVGLRHGPCVFSLASREPPIACLSHAIVRRIQSVTRPNPLAH
jgi:outer membrane protein assembly factor BamB